MKTLIFILLFINLIIHLVIQSLKKDSSSYKLFYNDDESMSVIHIGTHAALSFLLFKFIRKI